jgi:hypothetical protein
MSTLGFTQQSRESEEKPFKKINRLRKLGSLDEAWALGVEEVQNNSQDNYLKGAFFWVCYDFLKSIQSPINERGKSNKNYYPQQHEKDRITQYLDWILWLNLPTTGFEYSRLLFLFRQNAECFPQLIQLVLTHQLAIFDDDAKTPFATEKSEVPSLLLNYARKLGQYWINSSNRSDLDLEAILAFMNAARSACKDTQHLIWLGYDQAKCLVLAHRNDEARELVLPILRKKQRESWAWGALASTYRASDLDAAICLYAQGINCAHDDSFALPLLRNLALLLNSKGINTEASMCLKRSITCYENKGWKIKDDLQKLIAAPWYDLNVDINQLPSYLKQLSNDANKYLHGKTESKVGLVVAIHQSNKGCNVYLAPKEIVSVAMFSVKGKKPIAGDYIQMEIPADDANGDIISAVLCQPVTLKAVNTLSGELRVTDKGFGFVDDIFVPAHLINESMKGRIVEVLCYLDLDKKKGVLGKKAATLTIASTA